MDFSDGELQTALDGFAFGFIAGLAEQSEHILLVGLDAGLVEGVYAERIARYAAGTLEEVDQLSQIVFAEFRHDKAQTGDAAVYVG